jgi:diguanylate cyclase (GGDEF)-like protein
LKNRSKTALILHGDPALRRTMAHTLESLGYRTELARDAAGVRAAVDGPPADLLLFDSRLANQAREQLLRTELERHVAEKERLVESLSERTALLDRLTRIQQSISRRADSEEVLDAIVDGAHELLDVERSIMQLVDPIEPSRLVTVAMCGFDDVSPEEIRHTPVDEGANGAAVSRGELVTVDDYQQYAKAVPGARAAGVKVAMAAPVHDSGAVVGALLVCSDERTRSFSECEQEILARFAEHASLAITDARTVERMHNAYHDRLTGLPGRVRFMELVGEAVAGDPGPTRSVLLIDIVRFRGVNETFGHAIGDAVLVEFAERVKRILQANDVLAHFGGGDFGVLLGSDDAPRSASDLAEAILESLRHPLDVDGREIALAAAIGIA